MSNLTPSEYKSDTKPIWCKGCGHYSVLSGLQRTLSIMSLNPEDTVVVSGIGCSSRLPDYIKTYGFHGAHGRALPVAQGVKLANPELNVIVTGGDGDGLSIGVGHFIHAARRNPNITYLLMDNSLYAMTKGQYSPCSPEGTVSSTSPFGSFEHTVNPTALALTLGVTFVARGISSNIKQLTSIIQQGIEHNGFSFIEILSPCVTFCKKGEYKSLKARSQPITDNYKPTSHRRAMSLALSSDQLLTGILYKKESKSMIEGMKPQPAPFTYNNENTKFEQSWTRYR